MASLSVNKQASEMQNPPTSSQRIVIEQKQLTREPIVTGYRKFQLEEKNMDGSGSSDPVPIFPDFFQDDTCNQVRGQQSTTKEQQATDVGEHDSEDQDQLTLQKVGKQVLNDFQQTKSMNVHEKAQFETDSVFAAIDMDDVASEIEDILMNNYNENE